MALRSGYKGFKKLINGLKLLRPGVLGIDIGTGLAIGQDGKLNVTGVDVTVTGNPEEAATAGDLEKLQIGDDIFNVPDTTYSEATTSAAGLMSAADKKIVNGLRVADDGKKTFLYSNILSNAINKGFDLVCPAYRVIFLIFGANGGAYSGIVVLLRNGSTSANAYLMANSSNVSMADIKVALNDNSDGIKVSFPNWSGGVQYTIIGSSFGTSDASVTNDITVTP